MDGNAQNMFHGNHQGDAYYRYDTSAPRPMGPPGAYARHRAPHPLQQQQQPQYPSYQPPTDSMYTMGDQHAGMGGMADISSAWGAPGQAGPYGTPTMGYGHPQTPQQQQRQPQPQPSYRQHMTGYPQDPQKMQFSTQQSMMAGMMPQQAYGAIGQPQQAQPQQRVPQHYTQTGGHPMYPGAPQPQPSAAQAYAGYSAGLQHQSSRSSHVAYGHTQLDQAAAYGQHLQSTAAAGHHLGTGPQQQQAQQLPPGHPSQQTQNHLGQPSQGHLTSQQMHPSQHVQPHPIGTQSHTQPHPQHSGLSSLPSVASLHAPQQSQQQTPTVAQPTNQPQQPSQQQHMAPQPHPGMVHGQQTHPGMLHPVAGANQHQPTQPQQPGIPPHSHSGAHAHQMGGHSLNAYGVVPPPQQQQQAQTHSAASQQPSYLTAAKQQAQPPQHSSGSPQYRTPFPQLSPQMSPRPPQISPHPQMSPRPVMSPAKPQPPNSSSALSPHPHISGVPSPRPGQQQSMPQAKNASPAGPVSTLQALEQMVMPPTSGPLPPSSVAMEYPPTSYRAQQHQQMPSNPLSPMGPRMPMSPQQPQQQWPPMHRPGSGSHMQQQQQQQQQQAQHLYPQQTLPPIGHVTSPQQQQPQHPQLLSDLSSSLTPVSQSLPPIPHPTATPLQQTHYQQMPHQQAPHPQHPPPTSQHQSLSQQQQSQPQQQQQQSHQPPSQPLLQQDQSPQQPPTTTPLNVDEHLVVDKSHQQTEDLLLQQKQHQSQQPTHVSQTTTTTQVSQIKIPDVMSSSQNSNSSTDISGLIDPFSGVLEPMQHVSAVPVLSESTMDHTVPQHDHQRQDDNTQDSNHQELSQNQDTNSSVNDSSISAAANVLSQVDEVNTELSRESATCHSDDAANKDMADVEDSTKQESILSPSNSIQRHSEDSSTQEGQTVRESQSQQPHDSHSDNSQTGLLSSVTAALAEGSDTNVTTDSVAVMQTDTNPMHQQKTTTQQLPQLTQLSGQTTPVPPQTLPVPPQQPHLAGMPGMMPGVMPQQGQLGHTGMPPQTPMYDHQMMMGRPQGPPPGMQMAPGMIPHHGLPPQQSLMPDVGPYGPGPLMHHQEKAALQQQLQELYCMPPSPEQQEKIMRLQERLNMLQQHEANDQCNGGAQCILQSSMYSSPMIESPQVSSTTGRGRARGINKPRKPRQKKSEKLAAQAALNTSESSPADPNMLPSAISQQLPVSEDCVTPGAGLGDMTSGMTDMNDSEADISQDKAFDELDTQTDDKGKKKKARKPREPKPPKEPKLPKEPKERKKREPKDPNKPKKKRGRKGGGGAEPGEIDLDSTVDNSMSLDTTSTDHQVKSSVVPSDENNSLSNQIAQNQDSSDAKEPKPVLSEEVTDFDDIPVSKIPIKSLLEEGAAKKLEDESNENSDSSKPAENDTPTPKKSSSRRNRGSSGNRRYNRNGGNKRSGKSGKRKGNRIVPESDGEGDDMISTPPPSPPPDSEAADSSKRRSARNTQRKKYVDDVMLRFSDDEGAITSPSTSSARKEKKEKEVKEGGAPAATGETDNVTTTETLEKGEVEKPAEDFGGKPNYVYVNTTDEDSMVVQHVLAVRMGKRELKPDPPPPPVPIEPEPVKNGEEEKTGESTEEKMETEGEEKKMDVDAKEEEEENKPKIESEAIESEKDKTADDASKIDDDKPTESPVEMAEDEKEAPSSEKEEPEKMEVDEEEKEEEVSKKECAEEADEEGGKGGTVEEPEGSVKVVNDAKEVEDVEIKMEDVKEEKIDVKEEEKVVVEKSGEPEGKSEPVYVDVEEYFVKYRNFSYLHCEWRTEEELYKGDRRIASKIKRFHQKQSQQINIFENLEEEPFNPDFVEIDRILDVSEHTDANTGEKTKHYLIKWKSLAYEDSTWELEEDADQLKIEQYERFSKLPPKNEWKPKRRPHPDMWKKLEKTPVYKGGNSLRPYQLEGLNWLKFSWYNSHNCILADEMGLGKTIQSLTFIHSVYDYGIRGPFLVIAPLSTIPNWQREFEAWTDMNVIVYHGSVTSKQMIQEYEFYYKNDSGKMNKDFTKFNVLITTFEMIVTDYADLRVFNWRVCVIDEAHRLKNRNCKLLEGLRQLNLEHRVLLSGTPLQNNVSELFSLLNFLEPSQFASSDEFLKEFGSLKTEVEVEKLQALLKPMMLRRLKDDVEKSLAPKEETIVEVELTNIQKKYYRGILEQNFSFLTKGTTTANIPNLMNTMMELRKCCIHPYLLNGAEDQIQYEYKTTHGEDNEAYYKNLIYSSGKMVLIDKLLPKLKANGHRVLIFSQMVRCLDILEDYLMYRKYPFERIDGRIRGDLRQAAIDRFCKPDSDRFVFLLCTKAGGLGINLTAADTVIIYDSDWNPQNDLQAQARCHRIGQQKMVKIYRLLCRNTYEREMFDKASLKLGLDKAILQSMNTSQGKDSNNRQLSKKEIEDLLKKGAYGAIMEEDAADKFCEEDIDSILKRRTQVITMEQEKGSTFSKASFAMSGNRSDINIDDPDFWKKWAKKADIDPVQERDEKEDLVMTEPRRRTQIKRYGHDESVMEMSEDSGTDTEEEGVGVGLRSKRRRDKRAKDRARNLERGNEEYCPRDREALASMGIDDVAYGNWARSECFKVEKGLLTYGWGRWSEILEHGQFKRGWREIEVEELARIILLYCLKCYKGDEKIKNFIWDLITPSEDGEEHKVSRNHSGLHNLVPRGRNAKGRKGKGNKDPAAREAKLQQQAAALTSATNLTSTTTLTPATPSSSTASSSSSTPVNPTPPITGGPPRDGDPNHWSHDDKYDTDIFLESSYRKHLSRHANKVLLRVRMLYYIKHEIIGDLVQQINDGVNISDLPIRPPLTSDQMPSSWWNPKCCDKSLLVGTYKHGCESYRQIRADATLCFLSHCGPPEDGGFSTANLEEDTNSKHEEGDEGDDDLTGSKDEQQRAPSATDSKDTDLDRPSSSGIEDEEALLAATLSSDDPHTWPTMQDLNTRLRRVITSYQRNYKKEEMKQQQKAKALVTPSSMAPSSTPTSMGGLSISPASISTSVTTTSATASQHQMPGTSAQSQGHQQGQHHHQQQQQQNPPMPTAADFSLMLSLGLGLNPADANQLANWDISKLAMYLQKMGHREKIEQQVREKERMRLESVQKKWNRREENEFLRVLTGYGIDLQACTTIPTPDWTKFKSLAKLEKKSDESLSDYYKVFIAMCKRQASVKLLDDEKGLEGIVDDISEDHARLILDRLELLSKLRELVKHPKLEERVYLAQNNYDTPDWWESGKHDRELVRAVLKHGLYRSDANIFNDTEFCFYEAAKKYERELEAQNQKALLKMEAELMNLEKKEALSLKVEKPADSGLKIEKVAVKAESVEASVDQEEITEGQEEKNNKEEMIEDPEKAKESPEKSTESETESKDDKAKKADDEMEENEEKKVDEEESDEPRPEPEAMDDDESPKDLTEVTDADKKEEKIPEEEQIPTPKEDKATSEAVQGEEDEAKDKEPKEIEDKSPEEKVPGKEESPESSANKAATPERVAASSEKEISVEEECNKQAAELKARFPDLEVIQPVVKPRIAEVFPKELLSLREIKPIIPKLLSKQILIKWFRDFALEKRISHIIHCVEKNEWPVGRSYSAYTGCQGMDLDVPLYETVKRIPTAIDVNLAAAAAAVANVGMTGGRSNTPDVITITTDQGLSKQLQNPNLASMNASNMGGSAAALSQSMAAAAAAAVAASNKKRKRHIAIDVETERAKLHALLNNTQNPGGMQKPSWGDEESNESRRSSSSMSLQPPPAHQHQPLTRSTMSSYNKPTVIPGTSSTLTPIDLSSSLPKVNMAEMIKNPIDLSEVQDFSMSKSKSSNSSAMASAYGNSSAAGKSKLDNMLTKLMKKNNCQPVEEPVVGKEKKRRKLDEIVLGLSAAQEQKMYPDPSPPMSMKKPQVAPSVSVTPASGPSQTAASSANQKPFTITVTSVPGKKRTSSNKSSSMKNPPVSATTGLQALQNMAGLGGVSTKDMNAFLAEAAKAEQQAMLKQHQKLLQQLPASSQQRKAYEAMFAEMKHLSSYLSSSKLGSYPTHDAKVNKWLAEQSAALTEEALGMDYRSRSRSRQPATPTMQDNIFSRKALTGEESVPVINKITGKRLTGNKAPQLKRLTQWLTENPAYEIDPKWLEMTQNPQSPSPKPSPSEASTSSSSSSKAPHRSSGGAASSSATSSLVQSSTAGSTFGVQSLPSTSKKGRSHDSSAALTNAAAAAAAMQFPGLAGLNPNLLSSLPGLGSFDPKNPLLMPFTGMPGLAGMSGLGNLNNMNLFANLAGLGLGNLAGLDPQSLATMMAAAGGGLDAATAAAAAAAAAGSRGMGGKGSSSSSSGAGGSSGSSSSKTRKSDGGMSGSQQQVSSQSQQATPSTSKATSSSSSGGSANAAFPFLFPNPSLLYPLGLPYPLTPGMSPYDQLAQYSLLNGAGLGSVSSGASSSTTTSSPRQSSTKSSSSGRGNSSSQSSASPSSSSKTRGSSMSSSRVDTSQLQNLLSPHDPHLLESLSRVAGLDITQSSRSLAGSSKMDAKMARDTTLAATKDAMEKLEKERRKLMDNLSRTGFGSDLAAMQAFAQGKLPSTSLTPSSGSSKGSSKDSLPIPLPPDFSQALFAEMAAAAGVSVGSSASASSSSSSGKRGREQELKESFEHMSKSQMEMLARNLGMSSCISLIPTSTSSTSSSSSAALAAAAASASAASVAGPSHEDKGGVPSKRARTSDHHSTAAAMGGSSGHKVDEALPLVMEEKMHTRSTRSSSDSATIEKVTVSPVSGVSLSSLPSQTTITIAPSPAAHVSPVAHHSTAPASSVTSPTATVTAVPENLTKAAAVAAAPVETTPIAAPSPSATHEMDLEDLIAPSKVSKGGGMLMEEKSPKVVVQDSVTVGGAGGDKKEAPTESEEQPQPQPQEQTEGEKKPPGKRTRGKRPRSGEDHDALAALQQPERKRELRSSAGRAAAAAAARIAAEAKAAAAAAAAEESLNLSTSDESKT
ncbi:chromodomain-helicase-DNA-binding protein 7 isoform X3 [Phlebotomus papatasi]|uniref:chromodomain-helicase-DNA-binding protein 7 isoform X3 n=1 Tax=Phlebotomus papatasi TaxID=29031 RepID=UPI0024841221|nr:chromodomain-helicase-DNA-binding protein 7 isoform X3 [Phlebotomus papatasi]